MQFSGTSHVSRSAHYRRLRVEPLEDRRMLAVFSVDNLNDAGLGSLRQAIFEANALVGADVVEFQAGLSGTISLTSGELTIFDEVAIHGPGAAQLTIDAQLSSRIFHIFAPSGPVTIEGLHMTGGDVLAFGGAILSETSALLAIQSSTISGNSAIGGFVGIDYGGGGGIFALGDVTVTGSTISGNSVTDPEVVAGVGAGGGIRAFGDVTVIDSTISGNSVMGDSFTRGGGIYADGAVTMTNSTISDNSATGSRSEGGGVYALGDLTVTNSTISGNSVIGQVVAYRVSARGGGVFAVGDATVSDSTISGNSTTGGEFTRDFGGGMYVHGDATFTDSTISGNSVTGGLDAHGGGVFAVGDATFSDSTILDNSTTASSSLGGGFFANGNVTVTNSTISGNSVTSVRRDYNALGGGIYALGEVTIAGSTISDNSATGSLSQGGGIFALGDVTVTGSTISGNSATGTVDFGEGGGIFALSDVTVSNSTISGNSAIGEDRSVGGGIWNDNDSVTIENSIVAGNQTDTGFPPDLRPGTGTLTVSYSLIGDNSGTGLAPAPVGMPDANGNLIGTGANPIDPLLGPLQDNGGPTFTHALLAGSPAINAGDPLFAPPPDFDQRGDPFVRVADGRIDMGAFELQPVSLDEKIQQLLDTGVLNRGQANSLLVKLNPSGNERAQLNRLRAFINQVNALVRAGILSFEEGQCLIEGVEGLRMSLSVDAVLPLLVGRA